MPLLMNCCDGAGTFRLFVLQGSDCFSVLSFSPEMCYQSKHSAVALKKGTAENEDELSLWYMGGRKELRCCRLRRQKGKMWLPELLGIFLTLPPSSLVTLWRSSLTLLLHFQSRVSFAGEFNLLQKGYYGSFGVFYSIPKKYRKKA